MHRQKEAKAGQWGRIPPCQTPLTLSCAGYEYCLSLNNREKQIRTAHRCAPKVATAYLPPPPCGTRKELRAARLLDFFDRCGCSASLHPPLAALGFAPPFPSPAAGRAARSKAQGQPDLSEGCVRRDDAYKVPQAHFYVEIADRAPLPRIGEGGRGKGQMLPQATFGAHLCAVRI